MRLNRDVVAPLNYCVFILICLNIIRLPSTNAKPSTININKISENEVEISDSIREKFLLNHEHRVRYAERMKQYMNNETNPCEDFYEYACGNWKNTMKKRYSPNKRNNLLDLSFRIQEAVEDILTTPIVEGEYAHELNITQQIYQTCLSANLYPIKKSQVYLNILKSIGGFPAVEENWQINNFSWFNMTAHLSRFGIDSLIKEEQTQEYPFGPFFEMPSLGFDIPVNRYNIGNNISEALIKNKNRMKLILKAYEVDENKINKTIDGIITFWNRVINLTNTFDNDMDVCNNMSIILLQNSSEWNNYMDIVWSGADFDELPFLPCDYFYIELDKICNDTKEAVANYLSLLFLASMHANLESAEFQHEYCVTKVQRTFPFIMDYFYMKKYFNSATQEEVTSILEKIRENLKLSLENSNWLDEATKKEALLKESTLELRVGNFKDFNVSHQVISGINSMNISGSDFDEININMKLFAAKSLRHLGLNHQNLPNITKPIDLMLGITVNAFYYNDDNSIYVMAGVLHPPTYHSSWPDALKYGTLGYMVGHELTHATDSLYDSNGIMRNWWSKKTKAEYDDRSKCFVEHFDKYLIPEIDIHIDGNITRIENIADDGGLRQSFGAFRRAQKLKLNEPNIDKISKLNDETMPGLDLTPEQLFFLGFAQLWCSVYKEEHLWIEQKSEHTIDKYRVLGALSNNEHFSQAFNCSVGSQMNPDKTKCRIF